MTETGTVYLVGAGPGDPDLLTVKAVKLIRGADAVVYDRLVSPQILSLIPKGVTRIDVGKRPGSHPVPQESINKILVKLGHSNKKIVRLKGGDPMIFGRGGEEVAALQKAGVKVETVPGITAAQGCAASLNMALTERGVADSLLYVTGHSAKDALPEINWRPVGENHTTAVIYMGLANLDRLVDNMASAGVSPDTPALAIRNGTLSSQRQILTTLGKLNSDVELLDGDGPVLFIVGEAADRCCYHEKFLQAGGVDAIRSASC